MGTRNRLMAILGVLAALACANRLYAQAPEDPNQAATWQTNWKAFGDELSLQNNAAERSGKAFTEVSQIFQAKTVEWTGILKAKVPTDRKNTRSLIRLIITMDPVNVRLIGGLSAKVEEIGLSPTKQEWGEWQAIKDGSKVKFRCQIKEIASIIDGGADQRPMAAYVLVLTEGAKLLSKDRGDNAQGHKEGVQPTGEKVNLLLADVKASPPPTDSTPPPSQTPAQTALPRIAGSRTIEDIAKLKLIYGIVGLDQQGVLGITIPTEQRKSLMDLLSKLQDKYGITPSTKLSSDSEGVNSGNSPSGSYFSMRMKPWSEILRVDQGALPDVKLSGGKMELNLNSLAVSFDEKAEATVDGSKYRYANGVWVEVKSK